MSFTRTLSAIAASFLMVAALPTAQAQTTAAQAAAPAALDLKQILAHALEGSRTPALAAVLLRDGKIAQEAALGVRRNDGQASLGLDDVWLTGSTGKPITTALLAKLVDQGVLAWDTPLERLLPDLLPVMNAQYRGVTLIELLSHRSGLPENYSDEKYFETFYKDSRPLPEQRLAYIGRALSEAPVAAPGSKVSYSNTGFMIAAAIAERATQRTFEDLMRREIFAPLGMGHAGFGPTSLDAKAGENSGHVQGKPITKPSDSNPLMFAPAGNMHMRMRDWARFCLDQLAAQKGGGKLLSPASYRLMQSALPGGEGSLGWGVQASLAGRKGPVLVHGGTDGNWYALVALFPETGLGVLVATNAGADMDGDKVTQAAMLAMLPN